MEWLKLNFASCVVHFFYKMRREIARAVNCFLDKLFGEVQVYVNWEFDRISGRYSLLQAA